MHAKRNKQEKLRIFFLFQKPFPAQDKGLIDLEIASRFSILICNMIPPDSEAKGWGSIM